MSATAGFDLAQLRAGLGTARSARLGAIEALASIDSTNAELLRRGAGQPDLSLLVADTQHAGRGRRGREWHSPPGANLYVSLYSRIPGAPRALAGLAPAIGVACGETLRALGFAEVGLKWPNDLVARERKLGGVLIEGCGEGAVIGLGLNLRMPASAAQAIGQPWIDLAALGTPPECEPLLAALIGSWLELLDGFRAAGFAPLCARWDALDVHAGREIRLRSGERDWRGRACGIAADGGLRVRLPDGERVFHSADVSLRAA